MADESDMDPTKNNNMATIEKVGGKADDVDVQAVPLPETKNGNMATVEKVGSKGDDVDVQAVPLPEDLAEATMIEKPRFFSKQIMKLFGFCCVGFACSTMYGFDASLMSLLLVMDSFQDQFGVDVAGAKAGYVTALLQIGSVCAIPFIGVVLDKLGRRAGMLVGCSFGVLGIILEGTSAASHKLPQYLAGRFFLGFGAAMATAAAPSYAVEIAHPAYRGTMSGMINCSYDIGGILASGVARASSSYSGNKQWLLPTWVQMIFSGSVVLAVFLIPESPRWHYSHGSRQAAVDFLTKYHGNGDVNSPIVQLEIQEFERGIELSENMPWYDFRAFSHKPNLFRLMNCLTLAVFSAWSSGGVGSFAAKFYHSTGVTDETSILNYSLGYNIYSAAHSYFGAYLCNRINRRTLLLIGLVGMTICWTGMTIGTARFSINPTPSSARCGLAFYFLFASAYGISLTPLVSLYPYEVLSYRQRAKGASLYSLTNSAAALVNQFGTPVAMQNIGWKMYLVMACWLAVQTVWAFFTITESRGFTLEELDDIYAARNPVKESIKRNREMKKKLKAAN